MNERFRLSNRIYLSFPPSKHSHHPMRGVIFVWLFSERITSQQLICIFVITGFVLCGIVEQSASVALRANSTSTYSAAEFAEYVENTSYITRYCQPLPEKNDTTVHVARSIPHIEVKFDDCDW